MDSWKLLKSFGIGVIILSMKFSNCPPTLLLLLRPYLPLVQEYAHFALDGGQNKMNSLEHGKIIFLL